MQIDTVLYFTITDPSAATYEIANPLQAIEQLTVTTLRNVIGALTLEEALTSRERVNTELRVVLDERTGKWGIRVNRVELKSIDPPRHDPGGDGEADARRARPPRRDPHRRGRQAVADPHRRGREAVGGAARRGRASRRRSCAPRARRRRSTTVFEAIHEGEPDQALLSYQYLQMLPQLAAGRREQDLGHPERVHAGARQPRRRRPAARRRRAARRAPPPPAPPAA